MLILNLWREDPWRSILALKFSKTLNLFLLSFHVWFGNSRFVGLLSNFPFTLLWNKCMYLDILHQYNLWFDNILSKYFQVSIHFLVQSFIVSQMATHEEPKLTIQSFHQCSSLRKNIVYALGIIFNRLYFYIYRPPN